MTDPAELGTAGAGPHVTDAAESGAAESDLAGSDAAESSERASLLEQLESVTTALETTALPVLLEPLFSTELTLRQMKVLAILVSTEDGATGRGLSATFGVSEAAVSGVLDRLVAQGVAERTADPHDSRVRRVRATALGRMVARRLVTARPEFNAEVLARLQLADLQALVQGMRAVSAEMGWLGRRDGV